MFAPIPAPNSFSLAARPSRPSTAPIVPSGRRSAVPRNTIHLPLPRGPLALALWLVTLLRATEKQRLPTHLFFSVLGPPEAACWNPESPACSSAAVSPVQSADSAGPAGSVVRPAPTRSLPVP